MPASPMPTFSFARISDEEAERAWRRREIYKKAWKYPWFFCGSCWQECNSRPRSIWVEHADYRGWRTSKEWQVCSKCWDAHWRDAVKEVRQQMAAVDKVFVEEEHGTEVKRQLWTEATDRIDSNVRLRLMPEQWR